MYKTLLITALSAALTASAPPETLQVEALYKEYAQSQARSWPSYEWKQAPLIVRFQSGTIYGAGLDEQEGWDTRDGAWRTAHNDSWGVERAPMQPWFPIEGKEGFSYQMSVSKDPLQDVVILAHERFHRYQTENFASRDPGMSEDHLNIEALSWASIEDELYREALISPDRETLRDLAAAITYRRSVLTENSLLWEDHQMRIEGLADYTATKLFDGKERLLKMHPLKEREGAFIDEAIQWRHYMSGASLGYALDELQVKEWKERVERGEALVPLFLESISLNKKELNQRVKNLRRKKREGERIKRMKERVNSYKQEVEHLYQKYEAEQGMPLLLDRPPASISGGGSNEKLLFLPEGGTLGVKDSSKAVTEDGAWKFETKNCSHLFQYPTGHREVKLGGEVEVLVDGNKMEMPSLEDGPKEFLFTRLEIKSLHAELTSSKHKGVLVFEKGRLYVLYNEPSL